MDEVKGGLFSPEGELPATVRRVAGVASWPAVVGMEDPNGVRESYAKMFLTLWNVYRFHADYAALDGFDPEDQLS